MCGAVICKSTFCGHGYCFKVVKDCSVHGPDRDQFVACRYPDQRSFFSTLCRECLAVMAALRHDLINEQAAIQWQYQFQQWRLNKLQCGEADPLPAGTPTGPVVTYDAFVEANRAHKELTEGLRDMAATFNAARRQFIMHIRTAIRGYRASYAARHSRRPVRANAVPVPLRVRGPTDSNVVPVPAPVEMYLERLRFLEEWNDRPECRFITGWPAPPELVPW